MAFGEQPNTGISKFTGFTYDGKPITLTRTPGHQIKQERHNPKWFPEETKVHAATLFAATRDLKTVHDLTDVPISTLKKWQVEAWWQNVMDRVVKDNNDRLDAALTDIIAECKEQIKLRLLQGDPKVNYKTGEIYTVPLDVRALTMTLAILFDKRQLIRGEATSRTETISADKRLEQLRAEFTRFANAKEITYEHAVEEENSPESGQSTETLQVIEG